MTEPGPRGGCPRFSPSDEAREGLAEAQSAALEDLLELVSDVPHLAPRDTEVEVPGDVGED